ncbi:hypothetical protein DFH07DRAFT_784612 [Mycena maculata]|uniref:Uncharacterized protein n=1 Tax=Mycena maculata TaxID=230809 RepID=A0AAD7MIV3_9AGAR|nr:hypothetical protein DFH07DRAFT_784612 [Mycena maculata]
MTTYSDSIPQTTSSLVALYCGMKGKRSVLRVWIVLLSEGGKISDLSGRLKKEKRRTIDNRWVPLIRRTGVQARGKQGGPRIGWARWTTRGIGRQGESVDYETAMGRAGSETRISALRRAGRKRGLRKGTSWFKQASGVSRRTRRAWRMGASVVVERRHGMAWRGHGQMDDQGKRAKPTGWERSTRSGSGRVWRSKAEKVLQMSAPGVLQWSGSCAGEGEGNGARRRDAPIKWEVRQESGGHPRDAAPAEYGGGKRHCMWAIIGLQSARSPGSWDSPESDVPQNRGGTTKKSCGWCNTSVLDLEVGQRGLIHMRNDYPPFSGVKSDGNKDFGLKNHGGPWFDQPPPAIYPAVWMFVSEGSEHSEGFTDGIAKQIPGAKIKAGWPQDVRTVFRTFSASIVRPKFVNIAFTQYTNLNANSHKFLLAIKYNYEWFANSQPIATWISSTF